MELKSVEDHVVDVGYRVEVGVEEQFEVYEGGVARSQVYYQNDQPEDVQSQTQPKVLLHYLLPARYQVPVFLELGVGSHQHYVHEDQEYKYPVYEIACQTLTSDNSTDV